MEENLDIHNHQKILGAYLHRLQNSDELSKSNRKTLLDYHRSLVVEGLALPTQVKHLQGTYTLARQAGNKDLLNLDKDGVEELVFWVRSMPRSLETKKKYLICIKRFYKWTNNGVYPEKVAFIHTSIAKNNNKLPEDLITLEETKKMINACENDRDRCFISLLNEIGCRIGELMTVKIKHLVKEEKFYRITMQKSKSNPRSLKVIDSTPYTGRWLNQHPTKDPEDYFFTGLGKRNKNERWTYAAARMALKKIAQRAGVHKGIYPHNFRHSTATRYAQKMSSSQLNYWFGWRGNAK